MNDTPISDSTPHNVADLGMLCRRLERELNAANVEIEEKRKDVVYLATEKAKLEERIKRLEERIKRLEDRIHRAAMAFFEDVPDCQVASGMLAILEEERGKQ